jgi:outer membrane protein OmpA-like peptidoglycan-associated protein
MWRFPTFLTLIAVLGAVPSTPVLAQDLNGYQPPDMFGAAPEEQKPIAPLPTPAREAPPATAPVYKATPQLRQKGAGVASGEPLVTHPLTDALKGVDNKAPPPKMPNIADKVVPRPDMAPMDPNARVPVSEPAKPAAEQPKTVAPVAPKAPEVAKPEVAKPDITKPAVPQVAKAPAKKPELMKPILEEPKAKPKAKAADKPKIVDASKILTPKQKPQREPVKVAKAKAPAVKPPAAKPTEAKPTEAKVLPPKKDVPKLVENTAVPKPVDEPVKLTAAVKPAPPIDTVKPAPALPITSPELVEAKPEPVKEAAAPPTPEPAPKKSNLPKPTLTTEKMPPVKVAAVEKQPVAPIAKIPAAIAPVAPAVAAPVTPAVAAPPPVADIAASKVTSRLVFPAGVADIDAQTQGQLEKEILAKMNADPSSRLQIVAFATAVDEGISSARRVSLNRALGIRDFLKELGVAPYRMDVRAMGSSTTQSPVDRVDLLLIPAH